MEVRQRASFPKVKQLLRECNITYSRLFPARRRVVDGEKTGRKLTSYLPRTRHGPGCMPKDWFHLKVMQPKKKTGSHTKHGARKNPESQRAHPGHKQLRAKHKP
ncbi:hypothetical protein NDU88_008082 [Pleurodeles waltl]|uniref:Uncharacterized protein n=1 Tax=Pleurodeles waltl TaxID=8319 RepID=A0AAV7PQN1_PLEWA|nr:hypothetical protein NDU88_008082 [Pleurodeles waltl]